MAKIILIAAIGRNRELGRDNKLIWHLKKDLKFFRDTTMDKTVVMGRKTYESLPGPLAGRKMVVISSHMQPVPDVTLFSSLEEFLETVSTSREDIYVIGGQSLYEQMLPYASEMYLTLIDEEAKNADVYFPAFNPKDFKKRQLTDMYENYIHFQHFHYVRKKKPELPLPSGN